ncbi:hypothetical protein MLD38_022902 [Melastoma candidum]|uniref:Uncharacterized protein n=1 Tax=Melastoma candidum TaxID=119954 RepID=A0ACB9QNV7_9MYRT|nr:hypothetical protein MLD38_022902 [Melastoma candidum]
MLDVWSWLCELHALDLPQALELASSKPVRASTARMVRLQVRDGGGDSVAFVICMEGFENSLEEVLWVSEVGKLSSEKPFLPFVIQMLQDILLDSPAAQDVMCRQPQARDISPEPVAWLMDSYSQESFSVFFDLVLLIRLFRQCVFDSPSEVGSFYFDSLLGPNVEPLLRNDRPVLRAFLAAVGTDTERQFTRAVGYMLTKWLISREIGLGVGLWSVRGLVPVHHNVAVSYVNEAHGLWVMKGFVPVEAMRVTRSSRHPMHSHILDAKDSVLKYILAHQQLEVVVQLEYSVRFHDGYIRVSARIDNVRLHVVRLGLGNDNNDSEMSFANERHFPSRVRVWVGPEEGARYVGGLTLGRSTGNVSREVETERVMKGAFGNSKVPQVKAVARTSTRTKTAAWRWDQDAEGNSAVFDAVLSDTATGWEVASLGADRDGETFRRRYMGANRLFTKSGGVVFGADAYGDGVEWRLSREMEGSVLKWRIGGQVWLSYLPNDVKTSFFETRVVEWGGEVDLPLMQGKQS